ncbi:hypothetical protein DACRYDRAFT_114725 [Dacryopinax primogenitus]|uniref:Exonuclease domain-containing protein n=1 Tax=Dacryopinax primogenitus (strain DJM 731) TaxID=1858805 RepID=M5G8B5_DACPD|nr:uncharacterized protein DACRYDRAFT_114725 [Dacryopinax primogenitus]EJU04390.1 hypothetical protein DACRYDRAFT_114725 [Dacryopinax primogenitus]
MAYVQPTINGTRTVAGGHPGQGSSPADLDETTGTNGVDDDDDDDDDDDEEEEEEEEEPKEMDEELAEHAVSLATQWVLASNGQRILSRISLVNLGDELLDRFVRPPSTVEIVDYRLVESGLNDRDLYGPRAIDFEAAQSIIWERLQGRILVGHRLWESLYLLNIRHPLVYTRDLALYLPFQPLLTPNTPPPLNSPNTPDIIICPLPQLTRRMLAPHWLPVGPRVDPTEYAEAQMLLYRRERQRWEDCLTRGIPISAPPPTQFRNEEQNFYL